MSCEIGAARSPLFMPAWAARTFLKITDVRAERLQEITEDDALAEGIEISSWECCITPFKNYSKRKEDQHPNNGFSSAPSSYKSLWDSINKDYQWESNPWVFRYEFEKVEIPDART